MCFLASCNTFLHPNIVVFTLTLFILKENMGVYYSNCVNSESRFLNLSDTPWCHVGHVFCHESAKHGARKKTTLNAVRYDRNVKQSSARKITFKMHCVQLLVIHSFLVCV